MKLILNLLSVIFLIPFPTKSQSIIEYQAGTILEVTGGADICADNVIINGIYSGDGTKCGVALPVELTSFTATVIENKIELHWNTATEINNHGFNVERRRDSGEGIKGQWDQIGFVKGAGTSGSIKAYKFTDENLPPGKYSYRLKQLDYDGTFTYSEITEAGIELPKEFFLFQNYPNPFNPVTIIKWEMPAAGHVTLKIFEILGKEIFTLVNENKEAGFYETNFDGSFLSSGIYIYKLNVTSSSGNYISTKKMILLR